MKKIFGLIATLMLSVAMINCSVNKSVKEVKVLGDCKFRLASADSIYLAGIDVNEFKNVRDIKDIDVMRYPQLGLGFLRKNIPLDLRLNIEAMNPTKQLAGVEQMEYKVLLGESEIFSGVHNQRIEILPNSGRTIIPIKLSTNAYNLVMDNATRNDFVKLMEAMTSTNSNKTVKMQVKIKPTLAFGKKQINYPGYITFEKEISASDLLER